VLHRLRADGLDPIAAAGPAVSVERSAGARRMTDKIAELRALGPNVVDRLERVRAFLRSPDGWGLARCASAPRACRPDPLHNQGAPMISANEPPRTGRHAKSRSSAACPIRPVPLSRWPAGHETGWSRSMNRPRRLRRITVGARGTRGSRRPRSTAPQDESSFQHSRCICLNGTCQGGQA
jgi:hypothetical protein